MTLEGAAMAARRNSTAHGKQTGLKKAGQLDADHLQHKDLTSAAEGRNSMGVVGTPRTSCPRRVACDPC